MRTKAYAKLSLIKSAAKPRARSYYYSPLRVSIEELFSTRLVLYRELATLSLKKKPTNESNYSKKYSERKYRG